MNAETQPQALSQRFVDLCEQVHETLTENVARVVKPVADSTDPDAIEALLSEAVAPAVALLDRFMAELGTTAPDQD